MSLAVVPCNRLLPATLKLGETLKVDLAEEILFLASLPDVVLALTDLVEMILILVDCRNVAKRPVPVVVQSNVFRDLSMIIVLVWCIGSFVSIGILG